MDKIKDINILDDLIYLKLGLETKINEIILNRKIYEKYNEIDKIEKEYKIISDKYGEVILLFQNKLNHLYDNKNKILKNINQANSKNFLSKAINYKNTKNYKLEVVKIEKEINNNEYLINVITDNLKFETENKNNIISRILIGIFEYNISIDEYKRKYDEIIKNLTDNLGLDNLDNLKTKLVFVEEKIKNMEAKIELNILQNKK